MTQTPSAIPELSVSEAHTLLSANALPTRSALLIDVREADELEIAHISTALHIPLHELPGKANTLPRDCPLLLLCHHGGRSRRATEYLRQHGFEQAANIAGGIEAWAQEIDPSLARY